ncbi:MAG: copper amine oxidase N-terminal domain-containing protein, partial [Armatimonadota bacterium]
TAGRTLLPMRTVFEALGAQVFWDRATQTALGTRGAVTVRMTMNSTTAYINDRAVILDVPAQLINDSTYVPLRFPAEAFGAETNWDGAAQTVTITLPGIPTPTLTPAPAPAPTPTPTPTLTPTPQPGTVTGVVAGSDPARVVLTVDDTLAAYPVTDSTIILRRGQQVAATELQPGDQAEVQHDAQGNATVVRATFEFVEGVVVARVPNQILLDVRDDLFVVQPQAAVTVFGTNQPAQYADIDNGDTVVLRVTPGTSRVWAIAIKTATVAPTPTPIPVPDGPVIRRFYSNATTPLRAGQTLRVTLEGTPGGTASFDIGTVRKGIALREVRNTPGRYQLDWVVPTDLNVLGVPLVGHLTVGRLGTSVAQSAEPVTIDTIPPVISVFGPARDQQTAIRQPDIAVWIADENGSGVNFAASAWALLSGSSSLPISLTRQEQLVTLSFSPLPPGLITLVVDAHDLAGNRTRVEWSFTVVTSIPAVAPRLSGTHDAAGKALTTGEVLTVSLSGPSGGQADFSLGQWQQIPMTELPNQPGTYRGAFTVPHLPADRQETVNARLRPRQGALLTTTLAPPVAFTRQRDLAPVILRPALDEHVGQTVVVEGTTKPLAQVDCIITWRGLILGLIQQTGQLAKARLTADNQGHFRTEPIPLGVASLAAAKDITYTLKVTATAGGQTSDEVTVTFGQ